jgi:predicted secreted protein
MARSSAYRRRLIALDAAQRTLEELAIDPGRRVDVFDAIDRMGLWLAFLPLKNLLGAAVPSGPGGVMVTTERPTSVQRYTAAHELGHFVMDHNMLALDGEEEIHGHSPQERETLAQLFAGYFLMPPPLMLGVAARHSIRKGTPPTPAQAYLVSRDVGASYEAVVRQLDSLGFYGRDVTDALLRAQRVAKRQAAFGIQLESARADVWPVQAQDTGEPLQVLADDEILLSLPENRTTGYRWLTEEEDNQRTSSRRTTSPPPPPLVRAQRQQPPVSRQLSAVPAIAVDEVLALLGTDRPRSPIGDDHPLELVADQFRPGRSFSGERPALTRRRLAARRAGSQGTIADTQGELTPQTPAVTVGGTGQRILGLTATREGSQSRTFVLAPPHDPSAAPAARFTLTATVLPGPVQQRRMQVIAADVNRRLDGDPADDEEFSVEMGL